MKYKILVVAILAFLALPNLAKAVGQNNLPDLQILTVTFGMNSDGERTANIAVINTGRTTAGAFDMHTEWLDANGEVLGGCNENMNSLGVGRIDSRNSVTMCNRGTNGETWEDTGVTIQKSNHAVKLRVSVDHASYPEGENRVAESNENNNVKTFSIPLPDLKVLAATFGITNEGERTANVVVVNSGRGSAGAFDMHTEWLDASGEVLGGCNENMSAMTPGQIVSRLSITMCNRGTNGETWEDPGVTIQKSNRAVKLKVTIDSASYDEGKNKIAESNENNNVKTVAIPLPDLKPLAVSLGRNSNGEHTANVVVVNMGRGPAGAFDMHTEWLDANGEVLGGCNENMSPLGVGRMDSRLSITMCNRGTNGETWEDPSVTLEKSNRAVKLKVTVDSASYDEGKNKIAESNENNNVKIIDIPAPDLKIEGMNFRGNDLHPEVTIINKGAIATNASARVAYDWYNINGERLGGCYETIGVLSRNKRYTQKNVFCGNNESYKLATKFKATVDVGDGTSEAPQSKIVESNENNNSLNSPIPGRIQFIRLHPPEVYIFDTPIDIPSVTLPTTVSNPTPNITTNETPVINVPEVINTPITVPVPEPTIIAPVAPTPVVTEPVTIVVPTPPVVDTGDRKPNLTVEVTNDGLATYTVNAHLDYYGTYKGCTGPRYFDPIIVAWGQVDTHPALDSNNNFTTTHKYNVKNSYYDLNVSVINSCFQRTTKTFRVYPKL